MPAELWAVIGKAAVIAAAVWFVLSSGNRPGERVMDWIERMHRRPR